VSVVALPEEIQTEAQLATVAISGASGLVGSALASSLSKTPTSIINVTRNSTACPDDSVVWSPGGGITNPARLEGVDAFVPLAGENIATGRWTASKKSRIRNSRVEGTRVIASSLARLERKPKVLVCASAIGYYGDRGDICLSESSTAGAGFLSDVCRDWEAAALPAEDAGIRVVHLRIGVIISRNGGALPQMLTPFKLGVGGRIGSGRQFWSWVTLEDVVGAIHHVIDNETVRGAVNCVAPEPVTNNDFTKTLGAALGRPSVFPMPAFAARLALGQMANDLLLSSTRVFPRRLESSGYDFLQPNLAHALETEINAR
jgi:uncharacterized protein (TIGR01777 family)